MAEYQDLDGKSFVVTGANGGMGAAICVGLVGAGASVMASDLHDGPGVLLRDVAEAVTYQRADVADADDVRRLIGAATEMSGRLDGAVNAAAIEFETVRLADCDDADFDRMLRVNLRGVFLCMKHELTAMLAHGGGGTIVNLASTTSFQAGRNQPAYTTSKHGVLGLTKQAALDYAPDGIRINAIAPGNIDTPMLRSAIERRGIDAERVEQRMPFGRFGRPAEIADAALWLCSDDSSFTTGLTVTVEGGMLLG